MEENYLIKKWLNNALTEKEQIAFDALENNALLKEILEEGQRFKNQNTSQVAAFEDFERTLTSTSKRKSFYNHPVLKIAAVILLFFGIVFIVNQSRQSRYTTGLSQVENITLPDNSRVTLNKLSQLNFKKNWLQKREVFLEGEAYFKVARGKRFDVNTKDGTVSVLGTQFNVAVRDTVFSVTCYEGLVQIAYDNKVTKLPAGNIFQVIDGNAEMSKITTIQPSWLLNMKVFQNTPLSDVLIEIEEHYKITIDATLVDDDLLFTGGFELNNLENALLAITQSLNLSFKRNSDKITILKNDSE